MNYQVEFKPRAVKDLKDLPKAQYRRVLAKIEALQQNLAGDVKKLTNFTPEYRLRVGNYRVFFNFDGAIRIVVIEEVRKRDERTY